MNLTLTISGMSCQHCENRINKALSAHDGIHSVNANAKKGQVDIIYDDNVIDNNTIKETILDLGFEVI